MPAILERSPFYTEENLNTDYPSLLSEIHTQALDRTYCPKDVVETPVSARRSFKGFVESTAEKATHLPEKIRVEFQKQVIAILYFIAFKIKFEQKHCKIGFYNKENKKLSPGKSSELWSDTLRTSSSMASYWVNLFFDKIIQNDAMREAMDPLRSEIANKPESLYVMISCVGMIMAGANEQDPLSPVLAISKIYHEYLYYINSIVDNKHGVDANSSNYETKVRDYTLASNLVLGKLKQYISELMSREFLNQNQFEVIDNLFDELNGEMMGVFKADYGSSINEYFDKDLEAGEQERVLNHWIDHAVNMTGKWTEFFSIIGAVSANENFESQNVSMDTIKAFGKIWGYGQLINGFKDFVVIDSVADDIREKRCTPQILHLFFQAGNSSDKSDYNWIKSTTEQTSNANRDLTSEEKSHFVELFKKYGTIEWIRKKCEYAIADFWQVYESDTVLQDSLKSRSMDLKMRAMINGGLVSFFEQSRYLPK
jgi:hypothetical protein